MARPYRRIADLFTSRADEGTAWDQIEGFVFDWLPGQGPFPVVLEREKEYRMCYDYDRGTWVLLGRTAPGYIPPDE